MGASRERAAHWRRRHCLLRETPRRLWLFRDHRLHRLDNGTYYSLGTLWQTLSCRDLTGSWMGNTCQAPLRPWGPSTGRTVGREPRTVHSGTPVPHTIITGWQEELLVVCERLGRLNSYQQVSRWPVRSAFAQFAWPAFSHGCGTRLPECHAPLGCRTGQFGSPDLGMSLSPSPIKDLLCSAPGKEKSPMKCGDRCWPGFRAV